MILMVKCPKCGYELAAFKGDAKAFCSWCGTEFALSELINEKLAQEGKEGIKIAPYDPKVSYSNGIIVRISNTLTKVVYSKLSDCCKGCFFSLDNGGCCKNNNCRVKVSEAYWMHTKFVPLTPSEISFVNGTNDNGSREESNKTVIEDFKKGTDYKIGTFLRMPKELNNRIVKVCESETCDNCCGLSEACGYTSGLCQLSELTDGYIGCGFYARNDKKSISYVLATPEELQTLGINESIEESQSLNSSESFTTDKLENGFSMVDKKVSKVEREDKVCSFDPRVQYELGSKVIMDDGTLTEVSRATGGGESPRGCCEGCHAGTYTTRCFYYGESSSNVLCKKSNRPDNTEVVFKKIEDKKDSSELGNSFIREPYNSINNMDTLVKKHNAINKENKFQVLLDKISNRLEKLKI